MTLRLTYLLREGGQARVEALAERVARGEAKRRATRPEGSYRAALGRPGASGY